jgi:hypothetical protein
MSETPKKLVQHSPVDEIAAAVTHETTMPVVGIMFGESDGQVDGLTIEPYGIERQRDTLGRFTVKASVAGEPEHDVIVKIDAFAPDGSLGSVEFVPRDAEATA